VNCPKIAVNIAHGHIFRHGFFALFARDLNNNGVFCGGKFENHIVLCTQCTDKCQMTEKITIAIRILYGKERDKKSRQLTSDDKFNAVFDTAV
jgi:hypothetical protein